MIKFNQTPEALKKLNRPKSGMFATYAAVFSSWPEGGDDVGINLFDEEGKGCFVQLSTTEAFDMVANLLRAIAQTEETKRDYELHMIQETKKLAHRNKR